MIQKFLHRVIVCWCTVAVRCAESDVLIPELLYESVPPFHLVSRPQPSRLISAWLWWTHAPSVLGRTVFWGNSTKNGNSDWSDTHTQTPPDPNSQKSQTCTYMIIHIHTHKHKPLCWLMFFMLSRWTLERRSHYEVSSLLKLVTNLDHLWIMSDKESRMGVSFLSFLDNCVLYVMLS